MKDESKIDWDQKTLDEEKLRKKNNALKKENDFLDFRRRIITEVIDKIICFFAILCVVSLCILILFLVGFRPDDERPPIAIILKAVYDYLLSLPIMVQLTIIVFVVSLSIIIALCCCSVEKGEVIVLGKEHDW